MEKSPEAFRTISEVAELLDTPAHVLRFWESRFAQIRPVKRAGGRRYYRPADVALLAGIRTLLHDRGVTIRGVQKILRERGVRQVSQLGAGLLGGSLPDDLASFWAAGPAGAEPAPDAAAAAWPGPAAGAGGGGAADAAAGAIVHPAAARLRRRIEAAPGRAPDADPPPPTQAAAQAAGQNLSRVHAVIHDLFGRPESVAAPPLRPAARGPAQAAAAPEPPADAAPAPPADAAPVAAPGAADPRVGVPEPRPLAERLRRLPPAALAGQADALAAALARLAALRARLAAARDGDRF